MLRNVSQYPQKRDAFYLYRNCGYAALEHTELKCVESLVLQSVHPENAEP